jgi:large subunit ribosomal protein L17
MRHSKKVNHLGRRSDHRKAMLANMAASLIMHKKIKTTVAKAKALRIYVEPLITKSKEDSTHSRRVVFSYLQNKDAVSELFREISPKIMERPGGYTRILKTGNRAGDSAEMCVIELVDYNENLLTAKAEAGAKTGKRRRRGGGKKKEEVETKTAKAEVKTSQPEAKPETADIEKIKTEPAKEDAPDEIVEAADESTPEVLPEVEEEKKENDLTNEAEEEKKEADLKDEAGEEKKEDDLTDEGKKE